MLDDVPRQSVQGDESPRDPVRASVSWHGLAGAATVTVSFSRRGKNNSLVNPTQTNSYRMTTLYRKTATVLVNRSYPGSTNQRYPRPETWPQLPLPFVCFRPQSVGYCQSKHHRNIISSIHEDSSSMELKANNPHNQPRIEAAKLAAKIWKYENKIKVTLP